MPTLNNTTHTNPFFFTDTLFSSLEKSSVKKKNLFQPKVDILHSETTAFAVFDLPGIEKSSLNISIEKGVLSVKGERKVPQSLIGVKAHLQERNFGEFERKFKLGEELNSQKIDANFSNGVLTVKIEKFKDSLPRKIELS